MPKKRIPPKARLKGPSPEVRRRNLLVGALLGVAAILIVTVIAVGINRMGKPAANPAANPVAQAQDQLVKNLSATQGNSKMKVSFQPATSGGTTGQPAATAGTGSTGDTASNQNSQQNVQNIQGMTVQDVKVGTGKAAANGDQVTVNYIGKLPDGTVFDSSFTRNQPFPFTIGAGQVIKGWDLGIVGMKVGGERKLVIPPSLGYGSSSPGGAIPPNATLDFTVDLLAINQ